MNSKPDWATAPEWANFFAMDPDGRWNWFEKEPYFSGGKWLCSSGQFQLVWAVIGNGTLEARP